MRRVALLFGKVPVPYTVAWSGESRTYIAHCAFAGVLALMAPGRTIGDSK